MSTILKEDAIVLHTALPSMVAAYRKAEADVRAAFQMLRAARDNVRAAFLDTDGYRFNWQTRDRVDIDEPDETMSRAKREAWGFLVQRMELRRVLSIKRAAELDKQLETGEGLPEINEANILAMLEQTAATIPQMIEELVKEVFEYLRPHSNKYKTNTQFEIGKRVILAYAVERWGGGKFHVSHYRQANLRGLDNVFHALDGNGTIKTYCGPLQTAIENAAEGQGQTQYFRFKCCANRNLHLEFLRLDLVEKLNAVAGGMRLKPGDLTSTEAKEAA